MPHIFGTIPSNTDLDTIYSVSGGSGLLSSLVVKDEGILVLSGVTVLNFAGSSVTASNTAIGEITVTISGVVTSGLQGPIGPSGAQGIQGIQGPIGPSGLQGLQGPIGPSGLQGIQGLSGIQGPIGPSGATGGDGTFLSLTDTPATYSGYAGKAVIVNPGATALVFGDAGTVFSGITVMDEGSTKSTAVTTLNFVGSGISANYTNSGIAVVTVSGGGGVSTFLALSDTPTTYSGYGGRHLQVNNAATAVEFVADTNWILCNTSATYASSSTMNLTSGITIQIGDKVRWDEQGAGTKFGYVKSWNGAVLGIAAGSDYSVTNVTITNIYISRSARPAGFPIVFNFTASMTGYSTPPGIVAPIYTFNITDGICNVFISESTSGTSNATTLTFTAPFPCRNVAHQQWCGMGLMLDNSANESIGFMMMQVDWSRTTIYAYPGAVGSVWTNSGNKSIHMGILSYQIG
jgi:hypothetical protein